MWTLPIAFGGISGGAYSSGNSAIGSTQPYTTNPWGINYYTGLLYQQKISTFIISGYMYYNTLPSGQSSTGINCINLRTGALVWSNPNMPDLACGEVVSTQGAFGSGSVAYLWASTSAGWQMYDAFTGKLFTTFPASTIPPGVGLSGVLVPDGEILVYIYNNPAGYLALWNSTQANEGFLGVLPYSASPTTPWTNGLEWNVSIPKTVPGAWLSFNDYADNVLVGQGETGAATTNPTFEFYGDSDTTGALLWQTNQTDVGWGEGGPGTDTGDTGVAATPACSEWILRILPARNNAIPRP